MEVIILGSGSPLLHPEKAGPSTLIRVAGSDFLFDGGLPHLAAFADYRITDPSAQRPHI